VDFLKKHYEKVILLGLFVFFIGLMYLVQSVISSTREVTDADLKLPVRKPDYEKVERKNPDFDTVKLWYDSHLKWENNNKANTNDFVSVIKMARCPYCGKARENDSEVEYTSIIPLSHFSDGKCPECGSELKPPWNVNVDEMMEKFRVQDAEKLRLEEERRLAEEKKRQEEEELKRIEDEKRKEEEDRIRTEEEAGNRLAEEKRRIDEDLKREEDERVRLEEEETRRIEEEKKRVEEEKRERDRDGDGILNSDETRFGMDPEDPHDARYDNDGDGFSNIFELEQGYWPNNPLDHPPLWWRLKVKEVKKSELDVKFMALNDNGSSNKKDWMVQFNHPDPNPRRKGRMTSSYLYLDTVFPGTIDGKRYKVLDIERVTVEKKRAASALEASEKGEIVEKVDESFVTMIEIVEPGKTAEKLKFVINQQAYSNDHRPIFVDTGSIRSAKRREFTCRIGETFKLGLFGSSNEKGEKLTRKQLLGEVRSYRLKSVDDAKLSVVIEEVLPEGSKEKPQVFEINKDGKIPAKQLPIRKVQKQNVEDDVLKQDAPIVQDGSEKQDKKKNQEETSADPRLPRKPLIGAQSTDGSPRQSMFADEPVEDENDDYNGIRRPLGR